MPAVLVTMLWVVLAASATPVSAHDIYSHLRNKRGVSCCDDGDCRPAHYRVKAGGVQMLIDGSWFPIAEDLVEYRSLDGDMGDTNGGHWCGKHQRGRGWTYIRTYCAFLPPKLTSAASLPRR
jgi:hypothetical protein